MVIHYWVGWDVMSHSYRFFLFPRLFDRDLAVRPQSVPLRIRKVSSGWGCCIDVEKSMWHRHKAMKHKFVDGSPIRPKTTNWGPLKWFGIAFFFYNKFTLSYKPISISDSSLQLIFNSFFLRIGRANFALVFVYSINRFVSKWLLLWLKIRTSKKTSWLLWPQKTSFGLPVFLTTRFGSSRSHNFQFFFSCSFSAPL